MMKMQRIVSVLVTCVAMNAVYGAAELERGFESPPSSARPWVYWFWLDGNVTRAGITADLESMAGVGIGGVLIMDVDQGTPNGPVTFAGAKWRDLFNYTTD